MAILERAADRLALHAADPHGRDRRHVGEPRPGEPLRRHVPRTGTTDWTVYYVNPNETEILGRPVYPHLPICPRPPTWSTCSDASTTCPTVARRGDRTSAPVRCGSSSVCSHDDAAARAAEAGLDVVQNRCLKIEHARFAGGLHTAGFVTGVIDNRLTRLI